MKIKEGKEIPLDSAKPVNDVATRQTGLVTLSRYQEGQTWKLSLVLEGASLTAAVFDADGREQARLAAVDGEFKRGRPGLCATSFAAAASFRIEGLKPFEAKADAARLARRNVLIAAKHPDYPVVKPHWNTDEVVTPHEKIASSYDERRRGCGHRRMCGGDPGGTHGSNRTDKRQRAASKSPVGTAGPTF